MLSAIIFFDSGSRSGRCMGSTNLYMALAPLRLAAEVQSRL